MIYLLDTMVVSEPSKRLPHPDVTAWLEAQAATSLAISAITFAEVVFGVRRLVPGARRAQLEGWLNQTVILGFDTRILPVTTAIAERWAQLRLNAGRSLPVPDTLIAATALAHDLTLVTRNRRDFARAGVQVLDPWGT
jgi:toxin FitB